ncbi:hypothetical protein GCM10010129_73270 [Streptomyces fumigatiscleroticus]|nr:hypothetical protein GCM10010129_73270 [Streptomyces fumigatiscleroticus]
MEPPHTPRSAGDLPKRVPGVARRVSPGSPPPGNEVPADEAAPATPVHKDTAAGPGTSLPRLTRFSSLGSRQSGGDSRAASSPEAAADGPALAGTGNGFGRGGGAGRGGPEGVDVTVTAADRRTGDKARRAGFRGALGVVGVVSLLSAGAVALILTLVNSDGDDKRSDGASVVVDSGGYGVDAAAGLGRTASPSASASGTRAAGHDDKNDKGTSSEKPSASATSSAPAENPEASGGHATAQADEKSRTRTSEPVAGDGIFSHASHRCIDVVGGQAAPGAGLMIWDCSGSASQHWTFPSDGTMRTLGMCVQLAGGSSADGTDLVLASCNGSAAQRFVLNVRHDLVNGPADKCADVRDNLTSNGTRLQLWSCNGHDNQKWSTS